MTMTTDREREELHKLVADLERDISEQLAHIRNLDVALEKAERENEALRKQCDEWRADYNRRLGCPEEIVREFSSRATSHFDKFKDKP